jgi:anti-sigma B factor antagonist
MSFEPPLTFQRIDDEANGTSTFRLDGPLTLRNMFDLQAALRVEPLARVTVVDFTRVPYLDSAGMGVIINCYVHCRSKGTEFVAVGVCDRVKALFELTRVDKLIPMRDCKDSSKTDA